MQVCDKLYINGEWVDPVEPGTLNVVNPATEQVCAEVSAGSAADVDKAVAAAKVAFESYSQTTREERLALLERILEVYKKRFDEIAAAIIEEIGCPKQFATEVQAGLGMMTINTAIRILKDYEFEEQRTKDIVVVKEPIGVCGMITPWNWPINQIATKVFPALAAGCTMVVKPSQESPLSAYILAQVMDEAGVPAGVFNLINGRGSVIGSALSKHPDVDMVSITGSNNAGIQVAKDAADTVKRVAQELGGKAPNVILDDVDLQTAIFRSVGSAFANSGQICAAVTRLLVPEDKIDEAAAIAAQLAQAFVVGDPNGEGVTMGPVVSEAQFNSIQSYIQKGIDEGATLVCGGVGRPEGLETGFYVKPTVFSNVSNDMVIAQDEIFGPVLCVIGYKDEEDAIRIANDTPYGLAAYVQGEDPVRLRRVASRIRAGIVVNNATDIMSGLPFGGFKQSGNGREGDIEGLEEYLETKAIAG